MLWGERWGEGRVGGYHGWGEQIGRGERRGRRDEGCKGG